MAWNYRYADFDDSGSLDNGTQAEPWKTWASLRDNYAAGDYIYIKQTSARHNAGSTIQHTTACSETQPVVLEGYKTTPGDGGGSAEDNYFQFSNQIEIMPGFILRYMDAEGSPSLGNAYMVRGYSSNLGPFQFYRCRFKNTRTDATVPTLILDDSSSAIDCTIIAPTGETAVELLDSGLLYGCRVDARTDNYVLDSYSFSNSDTSNGIGGSTYKGIGQSFTASRSAVVMAATFDLAYFGSPTGSAYARIYASDGGSPPAPTGSALAESDAFDVSTITARANYTLTFSDGYRLTNGTTYFLTFEHHSTTGGANVPLVYSDGSTPTHGGSMATQNSSYVWSGTTASDLTFQLWVNVEGEGVEIDTDHIVYNYVIRNLIVGAGTGRGISSRLYDPSDYGYQRLIQQNSIYNFETGIELAAGGWNDPIGTTSGKISLLGNAIWNCTNGIVNLDPDRHSAGTHIGYNAIGVTGEAIVGINESQTLNPHQVLLEQPTHTTGDGFGQGGASDEDAYAQGFEGHGGHVTALAFVLAKVGSPTGTLYYRIYKANSQGAWGSLYPDGSVIAEASADVSTLSTSNTLVRLPLHLPFYAEKGVKYFASVEYTEGDSSNYINSRGTTSGAVATNCAEKIVSTGWTSLGAIDLAFAVYTDHLVLTGNPWTDPATFDFTLNATAGAGAILTATFLPDPTLLDATTNAANIGALQARAPGTTHSNSFSAAVTLGG